MTAPFSNTHDSGTISTSEYSIIDKTTTSVPVAHTTACRLTGFLSFASIAAGDVFRIRVYEKVNGQTAAVVWEAFVSGAQPGPSSLSTSWLKEGWDVTVTKISGTDRVCHWSYDIDVGDVNVSTIAANAITSSAIATDAITSTGIATSAVTEITRPVIDYIEFQRGHHTGKGNTYYVDGVGGNDTTGDGTRALPYKTITKALTVVTSNNHDVIILLPNASGGPTTITEAATINVTKNYVQIRRPGRDVRVLGASGANKDVFNITANGVELSGFRVSTQATSSNGVTIASAADFVWCDRLFIDSPSQDGIQLNVANNCRIQECWIFSAGRDGVRISSGAGSGKHNQVTNTQIRAAVGSGINATGTDAANCIFDNNIIRECAVGITLAAGADNCSVVRNIITNNTTNVSDSATGTNREWNSYTDILSVPTVTGSVGSVAANGITAASIATDAIDADAIAATAVTEIQSGLATAASIATLQADTDDIQTRLPAALVSGRIDASVGAMAANTLTASALATDAVTEIVAAVWSFVIEGTETITEAWRLVRAVVVGRASGLEGAAPTFRDNANTKNRVVASYASGTRTITSTDAT